MYIGENTWIGACAVIVPGVHIGKNCVIVAGSVVTKDIPDGVVAVGNPCRVLRQVSERDRKYFFQRRNDRYRNLFGYINVRITMDYKKYNDTVYIRE